MAMTTIGLGDLLVGSPPSDAWAYSMPFITDHAGTYFGRASNVSLVTPAMTGQRQLPTNCKNCGARLATSKCEHCDTRY
jgi:hypothetical protein